MPRLVSSSLHYSLSQFMSSSTANITLICCHSSWVPTQLTWHYSDLMPRLVSSSLHYSLSQFMSSGTANITLICCHSRWAHAHITVCCHSSWVPTQPTLQWFNTTASDSIPQLVIQYHSQWFNTTASCCRNPWQFVLAHEFHHSQHYSDLLSKPVSLYPHYSLLLHLVSSNTAIIPMICHHSWWSHAHVTVCCHSSREHQHSYITMTFCHSWWSHAHITVCYYSSWVPTQPTFQWFNATASEPPPPKPLPPLPPLPPHYKLLPLRMTVLAHEFQHSWHYNDLMP